MGLWTVTPTHGLEAIESDGSTDPPINGPASADPTEGGPPIGQSGVTAPAEASRWNREINIGDRDRIAVSIAPPSGMKRRHTAIISGALLMAVGLGLGWIGRSHSAFPDDNPASPPIRQLNSLTCTADPKNDISCIMPNLDRSEMPNSLTSVTRTTTTGTGRAPEPPKAGSQATSVVSLPTKQNAIAAERAKGSNRPVAVPETRPTTISGWTVLEVNGGMAVLEGPNGIWKATRGDSVPGVGTITSIVRWGNYWIVATSRGLISTR